MAKIVAIRERALHCVAFKYWWFFMPIAGVRGTSGAPGPRGQQGLPGEQGLPGISGAKGDPGSAG